jgi:hypothetical protein
LPFDKRKGAGPRDQQKQLKGMPREEWGCSNVFKFPVLITSKQASRDRRTLELCSGTLPADLLQNFKRRHDIE